MRSRTPLLVGFALAVACHGTSDMISTGSPPPGAMNYAALDEAGHLTVQGRIRLDIPGGAPPPGQIVRGEWNLHALVDPELVGGQEGHGELEGELQDGHLVVALYPGLVDGGCFLNGVLTLGDGLGHGMAFAGTWSDQSLTGPRHHGTFQAQQ